MKMKLIMPFALSFFLQLAASANVKISIHNPNPLAVKDAPVVIDLDKITGIKPGKRQALAVFDGGNQISSQLDDLDGDGTADELVFLMDFTPGETRDVWIKAIKTGRRQHFPAEVYADLILKENDGTFTYTTSVSSGKNDMYNKLHHHGAAFESELIAYRIYFDNKSTIDVYGKKKKRLELKETGWYPDDEQIKAGYGDDILRVSGSAGVGTVKGWNGQKAVHIDKFDKRTQRIAAQGNLRVIVESIVEGWQYEGQKIDMTVRYIQYARRRDAEVEVTASQSINKLATGVQKIKDGPLLSDNNGLAGSWGTDYPQNDTVKYAKETLGLGVYVPAGSLRKHTADKLNNLVLMQYHQGSVLKFHLTAVSAKEEFNSIRNEKQFFDYLQTWKQTLAPVVVEY